MYDIWLNGRRHSSIDAWSAEEAHARAKRLLPKNKPLDIVQVSSRDKNMLMEGLELPYAKYPQICPEKLPF